MGSAQRALPGGPVAQLVEHLVCNENVAGSNPVGSTRNLRQAACLPDEIYKKEKICACMQF